MMRRVLLGTAVSGLMVAGISIGVALAADGDLDTTFGGGDGIVITAAGTFNDSGTSVAIQPDGKIVAGANISNSSDFDFGVLRYLDNGGMDSSFGSGGRVTTPIGSGNDFVADIAIQPDGKIVVAGHFYVGIATDAAVVRYNSDGTPDTSFGSDGKTTFTFGSGDDILNSVILQADGKIVVAGSRSEVGSTTDFAIARLNADGSLDDTFGSGGKVVTAVGSGDDTVYSVAVQADGKIIAAGASGGATYSLSLARYSSAGVLDSGFGDSGRVLTTLPAGNSFLFAIDVQPDGKIVGAGESVQGAESGDYLAVRYSATGSLDTGFGDSGIKTFPIVPGRRDAAQSLVLQTDGKLVLAGVSSNGTNNDVSLARLTPSGALDTTFGGDGTITHAVGSGSDYLLAVAVQSDSRIIGVGTTEVSGLDDVLVARYLSSSSSATLSSLALSSGTLSPTFAAATTAYTASVTNGTSSLTVSPTATDANATISVNGVTTASGAASASIPLAVGPNTVTIALTAQDGVTTKSYTVTVTRAAASVTPTPLTLRVRKTMTAKVALASAGKTIPRGAKVSITVAKASKKVCSATSTAIKGLKTGTCTVTIAVTPKATKQVKKPKTTRATVTITVN